MLMRKRGNSAACDAAMRSQPKANMEITNLDRNGRSFNDACQTELTLFYASRRTDVK
jgi:hypothetical protein